MNKKAERKITVEFDAAFVVRTGTYSENNCQIKDLHNSQYVDLHFDVWDDGFDSIDEIKAKQLKDLHATKLSLRIPLKYSSIIGDNRESATIRTTFLENKELYCVVNPGPGWEVVWLTFFELKNIIAENHIIAYGISGK